MPSYVLVVYTDAVEGRDDEFNEWYDEQHLADVLRADGFVAARRYRLVPDDPAQDGRHRYLALYEVEADSADAARQALADRVAAGEMPLSDALAPGTEKAYYELIAESALG